jgi:hypothetical protein
VPIRPVGLTRFTPSDDRRWTRRGFLRTAAAPAVVPGPTDPAAAAAEVPDSLSVVDVG